MCRKTLTMSRQVNTEFILHSIQFATKMKTICKCLIASLPTPFSYISDAEALSIQSFMSGLDYGTVAPFSLFTGLPPESIQKLQCINPCLSIYLHHPHVSCVPTCYLFCPTPSDPLSSCSSKAAPALGDQP